MCKMPLPVASTSGYVVISLFQSGTPFRGGELRAEGSELGFCSIVWIACASSEPRWMGGPKTKRVVKVRDPVWRPSYTRGRWWTWKNVRVERYCDTLSFKGREGEEGPERKTKKEERGRTGTKIEWQDQKNQVRIFKIVSIFSKYKFNDS